MPGKPLNFIEKEKCKVSRAVGNTYHAIAQELDRSPHTIKKYVENPSAKAEIMELQADLADMFEGLAHRLLNSITQKDIEKLNAYQRTVGASIAVDKMRLLREESTENIGPIALKIKLEELKAQVLEWKEEKVHQIEDKGEAEGEIKAIDYKEEGTESSGKKQEAE